MLLRSIGSDFKCGKEGISLKNHDRNLQQAIRYLEALAHGIDPISQTDVSAETLEKPQIIACFRFLSSYLVQKPDTPSEQPKRRDVFITEEQKSCLKLAERRSVSEIAAEIDRVTAENGTRNFQPVWITDWLVQEGYLCKNADGEREATDEGKRLGITSTRAKWSGDDGRDEITLNLYSSDAQDFIFEHLDDILSSVSRKKKAKAAKNRYPYPFQAVPYPREMPISAFIRENADKCFIISTGSCIVESRCGGYQAVLFYKGRKKVLIKNNIDTNSANKCILYGIIDAADSIKIPSEIVILTSTSLGFHSPKSVNHELCEEVLRILTEKGCTVSVAVCVGKGDELHQIMNALVSA